MHYDSLSNLVANINAAYKSLAPSIIVYNTTLSRRILYLLITLGYINSFIILDSYKIQIFLKYNDYNRPAVRNIQRVSKPGNRVYVPSTMLKAFIKNTNLNNDYQVAIMTTSMGLLTGQEAVKYKVGGELLLLIN